MSQAVAFLDESIETAIRTHSGPLSKRRPLRRTASATASRPEVGRALMRVSPAYAHPDAPSACQVPACAAVPLHGKHAIGDTAYALVDFADAEEMLKYEWFAFKKKDGRVYAARSDRAAKTLVSMSRQLLGLPRCDGKTELVDHMNGNGLDNRRRNLRVCTQSENKGNLRRVNATFGFKGVHYDSSRGIERRKPWKAQLAKDGVVYVRARFATAEEAARAYDAAAVKAFGAFACTNVDLGLLPALASKSL